MSDQDPIMPDSPLGRALGGYTVPDLPADFADRVLARKGDRPEPLPELRPNRGAAGARRWRSVRRLGIATLAAGALATAAAATGLLGDLPINLPTPREVWGAITGDKVEPAPKADPSLAPRPLGAEASTAVENGAAIAIEGPINSPEELEEAFRRIDQLRGERKATRRENIDRRIDNAIERRRAQGLPAPTPEQEERLRGRIERFRERRDTRADQLTEERQQELRERVEAGEELPREDFLPGQNRPALRKRIEELRQLPPAERRERIRQLREQRRQRLQQFEQEQGETETPKPGEGESEQPASENQQ